MVSGYALDQYVKFLEFVNSSKISVVVPRTLLDSLQDLVGGPVPLTGDQRTFVENRLSRVCGAHFRIPCRLYM